MDTNLLVDYFSQINMSLTDSCTPEVLAEIVQRHTALYADKAACAQETELLASVLDELGYGVEVITGNALPEGTQHYLLNVHCPDSEGTWIVDARFVGLPLRYELGSWQAKDGIHFTFAQHDDMVELVRWDDNLDSVVCTFSMNAA